MLTSLKCPSVQATNGILSREAYHNIENVGDWFCVKWEGKTKI